MGRWQVTGQGWPISVNIAARHFQRADFVDRLGQLLARHAHVPPQGLDLEIVESVAIDNLQHVSRCLDACRALGVRFSLDDFGTGYSSLSYLHTFPLRVLKLDRSFVTELDRDGRGNSTAVVTAVVQLARALGMEVIAEGIETKYQRDAITAMGCWLGQGYLLARPAPMAHWLK